MNGVDLCQHEAVSGEREFNEYLSEVTEGADVQSGTPFPLGVYAYDGGVNFALFSRHATRVRLELFTCASDSTPERVIDLDPVRNRTGDVWHAWIKGIAPGPGTYRGLVEKIPYLKDLGVTAIELLPVQEFECSAHRLRPCRRRRGPAARRRIM